MSSSVDQWPQTTVDVRRCGATDARTTARSPSGACPAPRFSRNSIVSSAVQKRSRVHALTIDAQPVVAVEIVAPRARLVAVEHAAGIRARAVARQHRLDFARQHQRLARRPRRQQPGVHHAGARPRRRRAAARASQAISSSRSGAARIVVDRVAAMRLAMAGRDGEQMEVVIAEHGDRGVAQRMHFAQHRERARDEAVVPLERGGRTGRRRPTAEPSCRWSRRPAPGHPVTMRGRRYNLRVPRQSSFGGLIRGHGDVVLVGFRD